MTVQDDPRDAEVVWVPNPDDLLAAAAAFVATVWRTPEGAAFRARYKGEGSSFSVEIRQGIDRAGISVYERRRDGTQREVYAWPGSGLPHDPARAAGRH